MWDEAKEAKESLNQFVCLQFEMEEWKLNFGRVVASVTLLLENKLTRQAR